MDMFKMFEQAMSLSEMFKEQAGNQDTEQNSGPDFQKLMQMMQMFNSFNQTGNQSENLHTSNPQTPDLSWQIMCINAALPYLEFRFQKILGIMIRFMELQNILELTEESVDMHYRHDWRQGMLNAMKPFVSPANQQKIDFLIKFIELTDIRNGI